MCRTPWLAPLAAAAVSLPAFAQSGSELFLVDFEEFPESTEMSTQYANLGVTFSIEGDPTALPIIAIEGSPAVAFVGAGDDTPMSSGTGGLTDSLVDGDPFTGRDIRLDFDPPVTSVRFFIIDIDATDTFTARAFDGMTEVASMTRAVGDPGTGNAVSTEFFLSAPNITSLLIDAPTGTNVGYAMDFLTFTRPCEGDDCGVLVQVAQESRPGAGDFDDHVLGFVLPYLTTSGASGFYAYNVPEGASWNGQSLAPVADRSHLLMASTTDGLSLVIVHDRAIPDDPDGGRAEVRVELVGDPDGAVRTVEDDPPANEIGAGYTGAPGDLVFTAGHFWDPCCTDGFVLSDVTEGATAFVEFTEVDDNVATPPIEGLVEWVAYSGDGTLIPLALDEGRRVRLNIGTAAFCPPDFNGDGTVNTQDLLQLLASWGPCPGCPEDLDGDDAVGTTDLLTLLSAWGPC